MPEPLPRQSPLVQTGGRSRGPVALAERPFLGHVDLRGDPDDDVFLAGCERVLGVPLPLVPNRFVVNRALIACWLGPDEWWLMTPPDAQTRLVAGLEAELAGRHFAATDVSSGQTVIGLEGAAARALLARGSSLDLHPRRFGPGQCARSHLARALVLLLARDRTPRFEVVVGRSFADYLWRWLDHVNERLLPFAAP